MTEHSKTPLCDLSADYVRMILSYDQKTGIFTWRERPREHFASDWAWKVWNKRYAGIAASGGHVFGYRIISINDRKYRAHRLAWLWMTGEWPKHEVDHRDCNTSNNSWANLRSATRSENMMNRGAQSNNIVGIKGVSWEPRRKKWRVGIKADGTNLHLGYFDETKLDEASATYTEAARELHGEFAKARGEAP